MRPQRALTRVLSDGTPSPRDAAGLLALVAALILGGASQRNAAPLAITELLCLPALILGLWTMAARRQGRGVIWPLLLLGAAIFVPSLQLIPLPADVWTRLPGRAGAVQVLSVSGLAPRAMPTSLTREATWHSLLALLPPAAIFLATLGLTGAARRRWAILIVVIALAGLLLGLLQIAGGAETPLRIYAQADADSAVGVFANRDHFAGFLACAIPLALAAFAPMGGPPRPGRLGRIAPLLALTPILIMGVAVTGSRAGLVFVVIGLGGGLALTGAARARQLGLALVGMTGLVILAAFVLGRIPALARFTESGADPRFTAIPTILTAIRAYWPVGAGVGSFIPIYQTFQPARLVDPTIFNHAHDDYLEAALESGLAAVLILAGFLAWFAARGWAAWRKAEAPGAKALARAGSLVIAMILIHSAVDYPLRTVAMAGLFAFACGLMVPSPDERLYDEGKST